MNSFKNLKLTKLPLNSALNGDLSVIESLKDLPFLIKRIFFVKANSKSIRGEHAHRKCSQFLICLHGSVKVECTDSVETKIFFLEKTNVGLLIPHGIWAKQEYLEANSILAVLCDRYFESDDYIRDYEDFIEYKKVGFKK